MRRWLAVAACAVLTACGHAPVRHPSPPPTAGTPSSSSATTAITPAESHLLQACAPTRQHHDSDYTAGGLYLPGVADSGPAAAIDVSGVREPIPRAEPLALTGNRTPYTVLGRVYHVLPRSSAIANAASRPGTAKNSTAAALRAARPTTSAASPPRTRRCPCRVSCA